MKKILDFSVMEGNDLLKVRVALDNKILGVTSLVYVEFESSLGTEFYNEFEAHMAFNKKNAISGVRSRISPEKWIVAVRQGDEIRIPDGIDLGAEQFFVHLEGGKVVEIPFEILILEE